MLKEIQVIFSEYKTRSQGIGYFKIKVIKGTTKLIKVFWRVGSLMGMASKALVIFICTYWEISLFVSIHQVMPIVFAIILQTVQLSNHKIFLPSHRISEDFSFEHDVIVLIPFKKKTGSKSRH